MPPAASSPHFHPPDRADPESSERRMLPIYAAVVAIEAAVLMALWALGRYFGS